MYSPLKSIIICPCLNIMATKMCIRDSTILIPSNRKLQINYGGIIMANYTKTTIGKESRIELHEKLSLTGAEISLNELPAGANVPFLHSHKENEEIYGILSGRCV